MPFMMTWTPALQINDPLVDRQHQQLYGLLEKLQAHRHEAPDSEVAGALLSQLNHLLATHFDSEEALMRQLGLPEPQYQAHQAEHLRILEALSYLHFDIMCGKYLYLEEIIRQLEEWIEGHLLAFDLSLRP